MTDAPPEATRSLDELTTAMAWWHLVRPTERARGVEAVVLVETAVPLILIANRSPKYEHDGQNRCSTCGTTPDKPWYPIEEVTVIRHW